MKHNFIRVIRSYFFLFMLLVLSAPIFSKSIDSEVWKAKRGYLKVKYEYHEPIERWSPYLGKQYLSYLRQIEGLEKLESQSRELIELYNKAYWCLRIAPTPPDLDAACYLNDKKSVIKSLVKLKDAPLSENWVKSSNTFHIAAAHASTEILEILVQNGFAIEQRDKEFRTPLHTASREGNEETVKFLIRKGAKLGVIDQEGDTALHLAFKKQAVGVVSVLLETGASIGAENNLAQEPWNCSEIGHSQSLVTAIKKHALSERGIVKPEIAQKINNKAHFFALTGDWVSLKVALERELTSPAKDILGRKLLHWAVTGNNVEVVEKLLEHGEFIEARGKYGWTPMHYAVYLGHHDLIGILLKHGAELDSRGHAGEAPVLIAVWEDKLKTFDYLVKMGAQVNVKDDNGASLYNAAVVLNDPVWLNKLEKYGAYSFSKDEGGRGALAVSITVGAQKAMKHLFEAGHSFDDHALKLLIRRDDLGLFKACKIFGLSINSQTGTGKYLLHHAIEYRSLNIVEFLINEGADLSIKSPKGDTLLDFAKERLANKWEVDHGKVPSRTKKIISNIEQRVLKDK